MPAALSHDRRRGRAALSNRSSTRFGDLTVEPDWDDEPPAPLPTTVALEQPRTVITRNRSTDLPFDRSINAYRGCEHGCIYCYARPTHAWLGLSPGLDFETRLTAKTGVAALLEREISRSAYVPAPIALGTNTDPYQPIERRFRTTRAILDILDRWNHPFTITTKSAAVLDDLDRLASMAARRLVSVNLSITTLDRRLARLMEPRASTPARRIAAIAALSAAGIPVSVFVAPVIPGLTDHETESILKTAREAGARSACMLPVRLPLEVAPLFEAWLNGVLPERAGKVLGAIRAMRGGSLSRSGFGHRFSVAGAAADLQRKRFERSCARLGLVREAPMLDVSRFGPPDALPLFDRPDAADNGTP